MLRLTWSQDSCYDVAHKKRGRPRLRDESDFRLDRTMAPSMNAPAMSGPSLSTPPRPVAPTRQRRAESFRSIQSMTSEGSSTSHGPPTPSYLPQPPQPFQMALTYQQPPPPGLSPTRDHEVPTACLDLDLVFLRANRPFQQIMTGGRDIVKQRLTDVAIPVDSESITGIRNRLRAERESKEPTYLPPILSTGEDPLGGVADADIERFTQGFSDHTYTWTQLQPTAGGSQNFPARVRLAKAATYFVVITLPSFRPVEPMQQPAHVTRTYPPPHSTTPFPQQRQAPPPPPPPQYPLYQPPPVPSSRVSITEPPTPGLQQAPQYAPAPASQLYGPSAPAAVTGPPPVQLPPIMASPAAVPGASSSSALSGEQSAITRSSSSEEDSEGRRIRSPRKRRRMGIDEVLQ